MKMMVPPTTLRLDTLDVSHVSEENATDEWTGANTEIVISADLVVRGAAQVKAAIALGVQWVTVMTTAEFLELVNRRC